MESDIFLELPQNLVDQFKEKMIRVHGSEEQAEKNWLFLARCSQQEKIRCIEAYLKATQG